MDSHDPDFETKKILAGLYVLVVDDSRFDRELAIGILKTIGIRNIQIAENGTVAGAKIQNALDIGKPFDLMCLDSVMPSRDGLSLLKWIRKNIPGAKVIITTGSSDLNDARDFIEVGVDGFVVKPLTQEVLQEKIFSALGLTKRSDAA